MSWFIRAERPAMFEKEARPMTDVETEVLEAEARRQKALLAVDMHELDALFADDITHIHTNGLLQDKTALLKHIESRRAFIELKRGPLNVRVQADIAVLVGHMTNRMRHPDGREVVLDGIATQVLRREAGRWRFIAFQFTLNA
jgi:ketosteroid isomerase-like protein